MTESLPLPPPGWYPDGVTADVLRWFDGSSWTERVVRDPAAPPAPPAARPPVAAAGGSWLPAGPTAPPDRVGTPRRAPAVSPDLPPGPGPRVPAAGDERRAVTPGRGAHSVAGVRAPGHARGPAAGPARPQPARAGQSPRDAVHWLLPVGRSWQSVVAGYLGLVSPLVVVLGPVAIGFGIAAFRAAGRGGHGRGRAVVGLLGGAIGTALGLYVLLGTDLLAPR